MGGWEFYIEASRTAQALRKIIFNINFMKILAKQAIWKKSKRLISGQCHIDFYLLVPKVGILIIYISIKYITIVIFVNYLYIEKIGIKRY